MTDSPPINYRATIAIIEDAYFNLHGESLHVCSGCLAKCLEGIFKPHVEMAVAHGRQLQREDLANQIFPNVGKG